MAALLESVIRVLTSLSLSLDSKNGHLVSYGGMSKTPITIPVGFQIFKNLTAHGTILLKCLNPILIQCQDTGIVITGI